MYRNEERLSLQEWQERKQKRREEGKLVEDLSILAEQRDLTAFSNDIARAHRQRKRTVKQVKSEEQARITRTSSAAKVVEFPAQNSVQTVKNQSQMPTTASCATFESEIQVKPAFYVVADWNEFVENYW